MANRQSVKSNIISKLTSLFSLVKHVEVLNSDIADNVVFREDVALAQTSSASNITIDFDGKDRVDLTRTGGSLNITASNIGDGETKFLLITKTAGQVVTWVGITDITPVKQNANALSIVLYEIVRKSSQYFVKAWVENVKTATDSIEGVLETGTAAEHNALTAVDKIVVPGRIPTASASQRGIQKNATNTESNALYSTSLTVTPGTIPISSTAQTGVIKVATGAQNDAGTPGNLAVIASELKRKYDALVSLISGSSAFAFNTSGKASNVTIAQLSGRYSGKNQFITGRLTVTSTTGAEYFIGAITGYQSPGFEVYFPLSASVNTSENAYGRIDTSGNIRVKFFNNGTWNFAVPIIG